MGAQKQGVDTAQCVISFSSFPFAKLLALEMHFRIWPSKIMALSGTGCLPGYVCEIFFLSCLEFGKFIRSPHTLSLQESLNFFVSFAAKLCIIWGFHCSYPAFEVAL